MAIVNLATLQDVLGGTTPVDAIFTATIYRGDKQAIRIVNDEVIFPDPVRVKLVAGVPVEPLILDILDPDCHYKIDIFVDGTTPYRANVVLPGGPGPFDISELVVVDPVTVLPEAGTAIADAFLASVAEYRNGMLVGGHVVGDDLILERVDGSTTNAGNVRGPEGDQGPQGDPGPQGVRGPTGLSAYEVAVANGYTGTEEEWLVYLSNGPDIFYVHHQTAVSQLWVINHNLIFHPSVVTVDSSGSTIEGEISYNSNSQIQIHFSVAVSGTAYLS